MKTLHIFKSEPDETTRMLSDNISTGKDVTRFSLYGDCPDYEQLIELIFDHDSVITWW